MLQSCRIFLLLLVSRILFGLYLRVVRFRKVGLLFFLPYINELTKRVAARRKKAARSNRFQHHFDFFIIYIFIMVRQYLLVACYDTLLPFFSYRYMNLIE